MKNLILVIICGFYGFSFAQGVEERCDTLEVAEAKRIYLKPNYNVELGYVFIKSSKEAWANYFWRLDEESTQRCIDKLKNSSPEREILLVRPRPGQMMMKIEGANEGVELDIREEAGGWFYASGMMKINYHQLPLIKEKHQQGMDLASIEGDFSFNYEAVKNQIKIQGNCQKRNQNTGILAFYDLVSDVKKEFETAGTGLKSDFSAALDVIFDQCVQVKAKEVHSGEEFNNAVMKKLSLLPGKYQFVVNEFITKKASAAPLGHIPLKVIIIID